MEKKVQTMNEQGRPKLAITAVVTEKSYTRKDKTVVKSIIADLVNPFEGEDFEVELTPKWKNEKGIFDYKARKQLKIAPSFSVTGYLTVNSFYSKKRKCDCQTVGVYIENPFFSGEIEFRVRDEEQYSVLAYYCSETWGIKLSRYADESVPVEDDE